MGIFGGMPREYRKPSRGDGVTKFRRSTMGDFFAGISSNRNRPIPISNIFDGVFNNKQKPVKDDGITRIVVRKRIQPVLRVRDDFWKDFDLAEWSLNKMGDDVSDMV